jgi:hypothetical protein
VTAVEVVKVFQPSEWQKRYQSFSDEQRRLLDERRQAQGKKGGGTPMSSDNLVKMANRPLLRQRAGPTRRCRACASTCKAGTPAMRRQLGSGSRPMRGRA